MSNTQALRHLSPRLAALANYLRINCAADDTRPSLSDVAVIGGWTLNATAWRISHLRRLGLRAANGEAIVLARKAAVR